MMIFNLTKTAAEHLFPNIVMKTQGDIIQQRRGENIVLYDRDNELNGPGDFVFNVHVIKVKRIYCMIAIEQSSRWVHVIHHIKKGDVYEFTRRLHERLINGVANMMMHAKDGEALLDTAIPNYSSANRDMLFVYKSDRSCNTHSSQVAAVYLDTLDEYGLPGNELEALLFDMQQNAFIRKTKYSEDYFFPAEVMLATFLRKYTPLNEPEIHDAVTRNRKAWILSATGAMY